MAKQKQVNVMMQMGEIFGEGNSHFLRVFQYYKLLAVNRYTWENLPNGIESRHIEDFLFNYGQAFFTYDKELGYICLPCSTAGALNIYGDPLSINMIGIGFSKMKKIDEGVRILANDVALPDIIEVKHISEKISEVETSIDFNIEQQRTPYIIATTENNKFSMKRIFEKITNKEEKAIFVDQTLTVDGKLGINVLRTDAEYKADKLMDYKNSLENEILMLLGINTIHLKNERMLVDEVNANNSQIEMNLELGYKARKNAADVINKMYGLNIEVFKTANSLEPIFNTTLCEKTHIEDLNFDNIEKGDDYNE